MPCYRSMKYTEKQIRQAWKRATRRMDEGYVDQPTIDVVMGELEEERKASRRLAESNETFTLGELREAIAGPEGKWEISYYDALVRAMRANRHT